MVVGAGTEVVGAGAGSPLTYGWRGGGGGGVAVRVGVAGVRAGRRERQDQQRAWGSSYFESIISPFKTQRYPTKRRLWGAALRSATVGKTKPKVRGSSRECSLAIGTTR